MQEGELLVYEGLVDEVLGLEQLLLALQHPDGELHVSILYEKQDTGASMMFY